MKKRDQEIGTRQHAPLCGVKTGLCSCGLTQRQRNIQPSTDSGVHLQGIGLQTSKLASDLEIGDVLVWNYGSTSTVSGITEASPCFLLVTFESGHTRRFKKTRRVAWSPRRSGR